MVRLVAIAFILCLGCKSDPGLGAGQVVGLHPSASYEGTRVLTATVVHRLKHDRRAFTQGLVFHDGFLYESTGKYGRSAVRKIDSRTGRTVHQHRLSDDTFGEGLALVGTELVQITWHEGTAVYYDLGSLNPTKAKQYEGEGWGLCYDGTDLFMTSGGAFMIRRDPDTFAARDTVPITRAGEPVALVNELECVEQHIYANVYGSPVIVQIEKSTGRVTGQLDASLLFPNGIGINDPERVLNGIAYDAAAGRFFVTGKHWPVMYELRLDTVR